MSEKIEFVKLAGAEGVNMAELCRRFEISRTTGYKWLNRFTEGGELGLVDGSRRPLSCPHQSSEEVEQRVVELRQAHPSWGGRKLRRRLQDLGQESVPSASTVTSILRRHDLLNECDGAGQPRAYQRFEHESPNDLWQMDFKGHFGLSNGTRCHPLTVLDDHSRFGLCLRACENERTETVQTALIEVFRRYGLPRRMLMDNGPPWGDEGGQPWTKFAVWLVQVGVAVSHGRPRHPQTQGKIERWHRTLIAEVLRDESYEDMQHAQGGFDEFRLTYNTQRPHDSLDLGVPSDRYRVSGRKYPEQLAAIEYAPGVAVRKVQSKGMVHFKGYELRVGKAFEGERIGLQATPTDGVYEVRFSHCRVGQFDLKTSDKSGPPVRLER